MCFFLGVNTEKNWDDWDVKKQLSVKVRRRWDTARELKWWIHNPAGNRKDSSLVTDLHYRKGQEWGNKTTSACILNASIRVRDRTKEQAQEKGSVRTGSNITVAATTSRSNSVGDPCPSVSPLRFPPNCIRAMPRDHTDNTLVQGLVQMSSQSVQYNFHKTRGINCFT